MSKISSGKAVGLDPITDKWLKIARNFRVLAKHLYAVFNGYQAPNPLVNRARMMLLSKEDTTRPPIGRIRPIQMYTPLRKAFESTIDHIDRAHMWGSIYKM